MSKPQNIHDGTGTLTEIPGIGITQAYGTTVPTDAAAGYAPGCIFQHHDGSAGGTLYVNEGSVTSCDFNAVEVTGATIAAKTITTLTATDITLNSLAVDTADMTEGTGISAVATAICEHRITKFGTLIKTEILVDITDLNSGGTDGDIIGKNGGTANCHIGQITAAKNGTIFGGRMTCIEAPATGSTDIDLFAGDESTGAEDAARSGLTNGAALVTAGGAWTNGAVKGLTANPGANQYLYLTGNSGDATYTAGIFVIELWGK